MRNFIVLIVVTLAIFLIPQSASAQALDPAQEREILSRLKTNCYEPAKKGFEAKRQTLGMFALESLDFSQLPEFTGFAEDYKEFQKLIQENLPEKIARTKDEFRAWGQVNLDLASCYEKELADNPDLLVKAQEFSAQARQEQAKIEQFDFNKLFVTGLSATPTVRIPPKTTRVFRLRTFCLDSDRLAPGPGDRFLLAMTTDGDKKSLCELMKNAQSGTNLAQIQNQIWQSQESPQEETAPQSPSTPFQKIPAWAVIGVGLVAFLILLIWGIIKISTFSFAGKILWSLGLVVLLSLAGWGSWQINKGDLLAPIKKSTTQTLSGETSLTEAYIAGEITVRAISPGTISDLDVILTNNTDKEQEIDTSCIFFVPAGTQNKETSATTGEPSSQSRALGPQRVYSGGSTGEGAPLPSDPPTPEDLQKQAEDRLRDSLEEFKNNPTEENLEKVLDDLARCQQVGCSNADSAQQEIVETWQQEIDRRTQEYKENPSEENREKLIKATEYGQAVGTDTSAAEDVLGF